MMSDYDREIDEDGKPAPFQMGDRVLVLPNKMEATVIRQQRCYDGPGQFFWGNVDLIYDDGIRGVCNSWQLKKL
jgi:hypothetical protein